MATRDELVGQHWQTPSIRLPIHPVSTTSSVIASTIQSTFPDIVQAIEGALAPRVPAEKIFAGSRAAPLFRRCSQRSASVDRGVDDGDVLACTKSR